MHLTAIETMRAYLKDRKVTMVLSSLQIKCLHALMQRQRCPCAIGRNNYIGDEREQLLCCCVGLRLIAQAESAAPLGTWNAARYLHETSTVLKSRYMSMSVGWLVQRCTILLSNKQSFL